jgi:hypothetical protein
MILHHARGDPALSFILCYLLVFAGVQMGFFGFIIIMWGVFPRFLGYTIFLSCPAYISGSVLFFFWPGFWPGYDGELNIILMIPIIISEFGLAAWLLVNTPHPAKNRDMIPSINSRAIWNEFANTKP